jgi:hypothetical protein
VDYVDSSVRKGCLTAKAAAFTQQIEADIGRRIDWLGIGPGTVMDRQGTLVPV